MSNQDFTSCDPMGFVFLQQFKGIPEQEIEERSDGFINAGPGGNYYVAGYSDWFDHEKTAIAVAQGKVLDAGCGAGRHALYLQTLGFDVDGIDQSKTAIDVAKARGLRSARVCSIEDLKVSDGPYDTILLLGNDLGLLRDKQSASSFLRKLHSITNPDAIILGESVDISKATSEAHLRYQKDNVAQGKMPGQIRMRIRCRDEATDWFDYLLLTPSELEQLAVGNGWQVENLYCGDYRYIAKLRRSEKIAKSDS